ncbi:LysR substrate binding domain protein [Marinibacterium anthonyi]|nr:LysR substrate binding domain protein [Marinibacterium anthonyi]
MVALRFTEALRAAAEEGTGIIDHAETLAADSVAAGGLVPMSSGCGLVLSGFHLHYPDRLHVSPALRGFIDFLRAGHRHDAP